MNTRTLRTRTNATPYSTTDNAPAKLATEEKQAGTLGTPGQRKEVKVKEKPKKSVGRLPAPSTTDLPVKPKPSTLDTRKQKKKQIVPTTKKANDDDKKNTDSNKPSIAGEAVVEIVVPEDAHPGQNISVRLDSGHLVHAKVPRGFKPGMTFSVPISKQENHAEL